eukprot:335921_1
MQDNILEPAENDVLGAGRGNRAKKHPGNLRYHSWINELKEDYAKSEKSEKPCYAKAILTQVKSLNPPGRFLKLNDKTGIWSEIENKNALIKIRQSLRNQRAESVGGEKEEEAEGEEEDIEGGVGVETKKKMASP